MYGINFKLVGAIVVVGALALMVYDAATGYYSKDKLAQLGWTPKP